MIPIHVQILISNLFPEVFLVSKCVCHDVENISREQFNRQKNKSVISMISHMHAYF